MYSQTERIDRLRLLPPIHLQTLQRESQYEVMECFLNDLK